MKTVGQSVSRICSCLYVVVCLLCLAGCGASGSSSSVTYAATIAEGREAANEILTTTGAASISLAFVDGERLVWAETFYRDGAPDAPSVDTMYPVCSVSKVIAAIAAMKLVDMGLVSLDTPLTNYLTSFSMLSPEHNRVTVRMLLNHSSGFPGSDYRNTASYSPLPFSYSAQALETIKTERLKHTPGYMNVYCNDGFTLIEQLVLARTGKSYEQFVQDEILRPLGMTRSRYATDYFPAGSYAARYEDGSSTPLPQLFINAFGSGGLYSTPTDMAKIAMMFIGEGSVGTTRILSESSVAAMGVDQTLGTFNPVKSKSLSYGLGWDSVTQPALDSVGVVGWVKTGDYALSGAVIIVAPREKLGVIVAGSSGSWGSGKATIVGERILLRALGEKGRIAMPTRLNLAVRPEQVPTNAFLDSVCGYYANSTSFMRVQKNGSSLDLAEYDPTTGSWSDMAAGLKLRDDGTFSADASPSESRYFITADGRQYIVDRKLAGYGYCQDNMILAQKVTAAGALPAAWNNRLAKTWLMTNEHADSEKWTYPLMQLTAVDNLLFSFTGSLQVVNPFYSDTRATMMLLIPQMRGKELNDVVIQTGARDGWVLFGSYLYRPSTTIPALTNGTVTIGADGLAEWRALDLTGAAKAVTITPSVTAGRWRIYNGDFSFRQAGQGTGIVTLSNGKFYLLFHATANVTGI